MDNNPDRKKGFSEEHHEALHSALVLLDREHKVETQYSWGEYREKAELVAIALSALGLIKPREDNFIAFLALNLPESFFTLWGIIIAGGIPVPLNVLLLRDQNDPERRQIKYILNHCRPRALLANKELREYLASANIGFLDFDLLLAQGQAATNNAPLPSKAVRLPTQPRDLLIMPYTSGTGSPDGVASKGVMLSHENITNSVSAIITEFGLTDQERVFSYLPLGHISELITSFFGQLLSGYTVYFSAYARTAISHPEQFKENFSSILTAVRPTAFMAVPRVWINIKNKIKQGWQKKIHKLFVFLPSSWRQKIAQSPGLFRLARPLIKANLKSFRHTRHFVSAADILSPELFSFFVRVGIRLDDVFGLTETAGPLLRNGQPLGRGHLIILNHDGEMMVSGPRVMLGYYMDREANQRAFREMEGRRFFLTGDLGDYASLPDDQSGRSPRFVIKGRKGYGFKTSQGEFLRDEKILSLEAEARAALGDMDPAAEVLICRGGGGYPVALVFLNGQLTGNAAKRDGLKKEVGRRVLGAGKGIYAVKNFALFNTETDLLVTATAKTRKNLLISRHKELIDRL